MQPVRAVILVAVTTWFVSRVVRHCVGGPCLVVVCGFLLCSAA